MRSKSRNRTHGPYADGFGEADPEEFTDAQPLISATEEMPAGRQPPPPSSQAFLLDPHASLGPPSTGEVRIREALRRGPPTAMDELPPTAAATQIPAPYNNNNNNSLETRLDLMENKCLGILTRLRFHPR